jgi:class 3 adenylate cyclase/tetratricopeptide (TPR) repeat protein
MEAGTRMEHPTGTVTFLFTDIEGSTKLAREHPEQWEALQARHHAILRACIESNHGSVFEIVGDAFCAAFQSAGDALRAAIKAQVDLHGEEWGETPIRVRMGIYTGQAELQEGGRYVGYLTLSSVQRLMSAGHGGQVLLSPSTQEFVRDHLPQGVELDDRGEWQLKDLLRPMRIYQVVIPGLPVDFGPLRATAAATASGAGAASLLDHIVRGKLIGREAEMADANLCWQRALAGEGQVLLVSGEPGVGKTRFIRELGAQIEASGASLLHAESYAEGGAPYAPIAQMVQAAFSQAPTLPDALPPYVLTGLLAIAPSLRPRLAGASPNALPGGDADRDAIYDSFIELCARLSARTPLVLFVEDVHWADPGTLFLLRHLARRSRSALQKPRLRLMIVLTYREVELDEARALQEVLLDLNRERLATRIKLTRLNQERTRDMLSAMFAEDTTPEFLEGIFRETEGNPFFIEEVCKGLIEAGKLTYADGRWSRPNMSEIEIPQSVRLAIQARVSRLPAAAQEALTLAALIGREFDFETLLRSGEQDENSLIQSLEAASRAQLIEEGKGRGTERYSFAHALIPTTLYEGFRGRRRSRAHERVATATEALHPDDLEALAHHFSAADNSAKAVEYSRRAAGRAEAVYAHEAAILHLRVALDFVDVKQPELRRRLLEELADIFSFINSGAEAIPLYQEAITLLPDSEYDSRQAAIRLYRKTLEASDHTNRRADLDRLRQVLDQSVSTGLRLVEDQAPDTETVRLLTEISEFAMGDTIMSASGNWDTADQYARRAVDMAEQLGTPVEICHALNALKYVYGARGLWHDRIQVELRRLALSRDPRFDDARERVRIVNDAGTALVSVGEYAQALSHLLEAERLADPVQDLDQQTRSLMFQAYCLYQMDRWDEVVRIEEKYRQLEKRFPDLFKLIFARCFQVALDACVHARRGELEQAAALREESRAIMLDESGSESQFTRANYY